MSRPAQPVVFFAFANDRAERTRYLRNLPEEQRHVRDAMAAAVEAGLCEVVERANATVDEVLDVFQDSKYRDRVAAFHFGGHAGSAELLLESAAGEATVAHAGGLARFLGSQRGLELVFLNGCSSRGQVQGLLDAGVPAVIATSQAIDDGVATEFSTRFYKALASGAPIRTAYAEAQGAVQTRRGDLARGTYRSFVPEVVAEDRWPWELYVAPGAEDRVARWSLPLAARDPLFGLPSPPAMDLPLSPFKHLNWFTREDAEVFFGRGREIRDLYDAVTLPDAAPIVLLFGATGVGKSSLLAAGLAPRLEATHAVIYLRRDGTQGLVGTLARAFEAEGREGDGAAADLGAAWRAREEATGKPLVVILDQVEEAWTRPLAGKKEGAELAAALRSIFAIRETRPRGRLILGFRKEWLAEVLRLLDDGKLPRARLEAQHLGREGIIEAAAGPARSERLRRQYNLEVEPQVAEEIAGDLSEDVEAAVAPALQILLSKMWAVASKESPGAPRFTVELYQRLKRQGILLDDFLEEQLSGLKDWRPELVESGLALDLLAHHTTPLGTAETRQAGEVVERYGGRGEVVELLGQCNDRYLLTGTARVQEGALAGNPDDTEDKGTTRLAHDTLAPLVRRRFEASDLPGQRAVRVLQQRAVEWVGSKEGSPLDEVDLTLVEQGAAGMRAWTADEQKLVAASRREREQRARRRRTLWIGAAAAAAVIAVAACVALWQWIAALKAKEKAQNIARVAVAAEWLEKDPTRAALVLLEVTEPNETAYAVQRMRDALAGPLSEAVLRHQDEVKSAAFSHDGKRIVTVSGNEVSGNLRTWVWIADGSGGFVAREGPKGLESSADFSPHGSHIVIASGDGTARVWAADGSGKRVGEPVAVIADPKYMVWEAAISPDGTRVFTRDGGNVARLWAIDRNPVEVIDGPTSFASKAAFSPDGTRLVTVSDGAEVWAVDDSDEPIKLLGHKDSVWSAAFSPDGTRVVTASEDGTARVWKVDGYEPVVLGDDVIELSSDGAHVLTGSEDGTVRLGPADGSGGKKPVVLGGNEMSGAAFSPDGKHVLITSEDGTVRLGPADGSRKPVILRGYQGPVESAAFSPDGKHVLTTSKDGTVRLGPADGSGRPVILLGHQDPLAFSADGRLVIASEDKTARVWAADGSGEAVVLRDHDNEVTSAAFSPDGKRVVTVSDDKTARVWAADGSGKPVVLGGHEYSVSDAVFSPDGKHVLTTSEDGSQRLGPADGSRKPAVLGVLMSVEFSADGKRVLTVSFDGTVRVGAADDLGNPRALITLTNLGAFGSASFSPDGKYVLTHPGTIPGSDYQQMQVMAADGTGEPILSIDYAEDVAFSSDGTRVVTKFKSQDDTVTVKVYAIGGRLLQALIRAATATCLEPEFRFRFLGETRDVARETSKRCQRCVKTRQSDIRSVRAAPEQAWAKWQKCMAR